MPALVIDGRAVAETLRGELRIRSEELRRRGVIPRLVVSLVGEDPASLAYARNLERTGTRVAVDVGIDALPRDASAETLIGRLRRLGDDPAVHGIILQQPLPPQIDVARVAESLPIAKDVDGTSPHSQGLLAARSPHAFVPATPAAIVLLLEHSPAWPLEGKTAVVVGRSRVVGLPVALLLLAANATVTIAHSRTRDLARIVREGEVVVAAAGVPRLISGEAIRPGATVIDAGTNVVEGGLVGDVDFDGASEVARAITPVPGGVGPVTNVALMRNVIIAAERTLG